jgi:hypothetical protein
LGLFDYLYRNNFILKENLQMSKKLLSEAQVRRFQSLANIEPLTEMAYNEEETMEETYNEELVNEEETITEVEEEQPEMEMDADEPEMEEADVEMDEELVQKFMDAVATIQQVADILNGEAEEEEMEMDAEEAEMEMDAAEPMEMGDEEAPAPEDEEAMLQEALSGINYIPSREEVVKTVAQRVIDRLNEAKDAQAKLDKALGKK